MAVVKAEIWPLEQVQRDIDMAAKIMHAKVVCLLGGEPTSHPKLVEIMRYAKAAGLGERQQVLTNGMRLHRMKPEFWAELDWLKISIYPDKTPLKNIALAEQMRDEHGFELEYYDVKDDPFRAVLTDRPRTRESAQQTYDGCWYRQFTRKIEQGYFYRCCTSPSISKTILGLEPDVDGIKLEGLTPRGLQEFLDRPEPMQSCFRCYGNLGPRIEEWSEVRDHDGWMDASIYPLPDHLAA